MYSAPAPEKTDYLLTLRGLAAIGVLLGHAFGIGEYSIGVYISDSNTGVLELAAIFHPLSHLKEFLFILVPLLGSNFVVLFFVQSGYLMGKIFHDGRYSLSANGILQFYKNRYLRLAPLLYFNLLIAACFFVNAQFSPRMILGDLLFITNFTDHGLNLVTWSLSHEMQYYLLAPGVFWLFKAANRRAFAWLCISIAVIFLITRSGFLMHFEYLFAFLVGYAVNIVLRLYPHARVREAHKVVAVLLCVALVNVVYNWLFLIGHYELGTIAVALISAAAVYVTECASSYDISLAHPGFAKLVRFGMFTGTLSYGIYLWHYMVIISRAPLFARLVDRASAILGGAPEWQKIILFHAFQLSFTLVVTYALAIATFYGIETRFRPGLYRSARNDRLAATGEQPAQ